MDRKKSLSGGNYQSHRDDILRRARGEVSGLTNDISNINAEKEQEIITIVDKPVKLGDSSIVEFITDDISYSYERGADKVSFSCSGIENISGSSTGLLSLCCWISEKSLENGLWQNENHSLVDIVELGSLDKEEAFLDINQTFNISDENLEIINQRNNFYAEWHFIFTINELNEDGNAYIINTINGSNENEGRRLPLSDESLTIIGSNEQLIVHINNEEFTGVLYSSDERYEIFVEDSEATYIVLYHKNGNIAEIVSKDEKKTFDEEGNEIKEGLFISRYGDEFDETISKASEELDNNMTLKFETYDNGDRYEGEFNNEGLRHGYGTYYWADGSKFVGNWKNGKKQGNGEYYNERGVLTQKGYWIEDRLISNNHW